MKLSIIIPVYNEKDSVTELHAELVSSLAQWAPDAEIIFVDDGSTDGTAEALAALSDVQAITLAKNYGKSAALDAGFEAAAGDITVVMDGDLQVDPSDIRKLAAKMEEGYDVVNGWRRKRWKGQFLTRKLPSVMANWWISKLTGVRLKDHGSSIRAFRASYLRYRSYQEDMQRMLPVQLALFGARYTEIEVNVRNRKYGVSKFAGASRFIQVILNAILFYFFNRFERRPMHFFGGIGMASLFLGFITFVVAMWLKYAGHINFSRTPLPTLIAILAVIGFQFILMGVLAELVNKNRSAKERPYIIKKQ